ncbi:MAG: 4-oxalocrotonate tautomerase family protein [Aeromicrobium erythreum]
MPIITIEMLAGRSADQKRAVAAALTDVAVEVLAVERSTVQVHLHEMAPGDVAIGGQLVSDLRPA